MTQAEADSTSTYGGQNTKCPDSGRERGDLSERQRWSLEQFEWFADALEEAGIDTDGRFVHLPPGQKRPPTHSFSENPEERKSRPATRRWLAKGGNYAVYCGEVHSTGDEGRYLGVFDLDTYKKSYSSCLYEALKHHYLATTLRGRSPHGGLHAWFLFTEDLIEWVTQEYRRTNLQEGKFGEMMLDNQWVVGPGSIIDEDGKNGCTHEGCDCTEYGGGRYHLDYWEPPKTLTADIGQEVFTTVFDTLSALRTSDNGQNENATAATDISPEGPSSCSSEPRTERAVALPDEWEVPAPIREVFCERLPQQDNRLDELLAFERGDLAVSDSPFLMKKYERHRRSAIESALVWRLLAYRWDGTDDMLQTAVNEVYGFLNEVVTGVDAVKTLDGPQDPKWAVEGRSYHRGRFEYAIPDIAEADAYDRYTFSDSEGTVKPPSNTSSPSSPGEDEGVLMRRGVKRESAVDIISVLQVQSKEFTAEEVASELEVISDHPVGAAQVREVLRLLREAGYLSGPENRGGNTGHVWVKQKTPLIESEQELELLFEQYADRFPTELEINHQQRRHLERRDT